MKDRLAAAMEARNRPVRYLVEQTGLTKSAIHFMLSGTTRPETVRAVNVDLLADALEISRDWLLYGRGQMARDEPVKNAAGGLPSASQNETLDPATLAEAEKWVRFEEGGGQMFQPLRRAERLIALYLMARQDGGSLSPEHAEAVIEAARKRLDQQGGQHGRSKGKQGGASS